MQGQGPTVVHPGAGSEIVPEMLIRTVIMEGLAELAGDAPRLEQLYARVDQLYGSTAEGFAEGWGDVLRAMLTAEPGAGRVRVGVGYPTTAAVLPYVGIVLDSGGEDAGGAVAGDCLGQTYEQLGIPSYTDPAASRVVRHRVQGTAWDSRIMVSCWHRAPEGSTLMHAAVREILFRKKGALSTAGVQDLSFSESGFAPDQTLYPDTGYVPTIRVSMSWTLRTIRRKDPVPTRIDVRGGRFSNS